MRNSAEKLEKIAESSANAADARKLYETVSKKQKLNTSTVSKIVGGISCRKAGGTQQDF